MHLVGIDLGWKMNPPRRAGTGYCVLDDHGRMTDLRLLTEDDEIVRLLSRHEEVWVGIDAPLIVPNRRGVRKCERRLLDRGIKLLPANQEFMQRRFGGCRGERLMSLLREDGFSLAPLHSHRMVFEVYPFGMMTVLMGGRVPGYKRGSVGVRRKRALAVLEAASRWAGVTLSPALRAELLGQKAGLRTVMDKLDAYLCVLCVYAHWLYGGRTTRLTGGSEDGYILLPEIEV